VRRDTFNDLQRFDEAIPLLSSSIVGCRNWGDGIDCEQILRYVHQEVLFSKFLEAGPKIVHLIGTDSP
jgi:hypothetical protein